jgi:hypothetical protein
MCSAFILIVIALIVEVVVRQFKKIKQKNKGVDNEDIS